MTSGLNRFWATFAGIGVALFLLAGLPGRALPQVGIGTQADEADVQFRLGNNAYKKRDYQKALSHYFASNRLAPNRNVLFNLARCYEQLKRHVEAYRYYQAFASSGDLKPARKKAVEQALRRVQAYVSLLRIASQPQGATVFLNRRDLGSYGTTPAVLAVAPGTYKVILDLPGYEPHQREGVSVEVGQAANLEVRLDRVVGRVRVTGEPAGAQIRIDDEGGAVTGKLPAELVVSPGSHSILITRTGYVPLESKLRVEPGAVAKLEVSLEPEMGALLVQADEKDALIRINGQPAGFTPTVIDKLPTGEHRVSIELAGFRNYEAQVEILPGVQGLLNVELEILEDVSAASRLLESARDAPASVSLIGRRELEAFGYTTLADAVVGQRGMFVSDDLTYQSMGVRGFSRFGQYGNRVLVLLDGHSLNDDWIGSSYIGTDLLTDLDSIERIELIRGPGSALYGTGAFFGVINLVSPSRVEETGVRAGVGMIGPGTARTRASATVRLGEEAGFWLSAGGLAGQAGNYFSPSRFGSDDFPDGIARDVGGQRAATGLGRLYWRDLTLQFYYHLREKDIPTGSFETLFSDKREYTDDNRAFVELRYEPKIGDWFQLLSRLYYDHYEYHGSFPYEADEGGLAREFYLGDWAGAEVRGVVSPGFGLRLTIGGSYEMHFSSPAQGADEEGGYLAEVHPFTAVSGYLVADYAPLSWLSLSAGGRFDGWWIEGLVNDSGQPEGRFLYSINPRVGLILQLTGDDTFKLLGGRAFRAPSIYELTYWDGGITQVQSPDLEPELIYTGEIEYTRRLPAGFWLVASLFLNHISDLIEQELNEQDLLYYYNLEDPVWTLGGELELRKEFRRGWMLGLHYSFQRSRLDKLSDSQELINSPAHLAGARLILPLAGKALRFATRLSVESGRLDRDMERTDPVVLWDVALSGDIEDLHLHYSAGVRNLLDWKVDHPVGEDLLDPRMRQRGLTIVVDLGFSY